MKKVLIATPFSQSKTECIDEYNKGVISMIHSKDFYVELFLYADMIQPEFDATTSLLQHATFYAERNNFTHVLVLDSDLYLDENRLKKLLDENKAIILTGNGSGSGTKTVDPLKVSGLNWGCFLVELNVLRELPISIAYSGDYLSPKRMWFKRLYQFGYKVWRCYDVTPTKINAEEIKTIGEKNEKN